MDELVTAPSLEPEGGSAPRLADYEIVRRLGRGGMSTVYLARQRSLDRHVALKELAAIHAGDAQLAARFMRESRLAGAIAHPNVVAVYEYLESRGVPYIVMEYMPEGSLRSRIGTLSDAQVFGILEDVLAGLRAAAGRGIVHRDLKPENILVAADGGVKIGDFGIAKAADALQADGFQTGSGVALGTPSYMAPEQVEGGAVSPRTDLYSLGVVAYEMLAGELPLSREGGMWAVLRRHLDDPPVPLSRHRPDLEPRIVEWVHALLAKRAEDRPADAREAWERLEDVIVDVEGPRWRRTASLVGAEEKPPPVREVRRDRSRWLRRGAAAISACVLAGVAVTLQADEEPGRTRTSAANYRAQAAAALAPADEAGRKLSTRLAALQPEDSGRGARNALADAVGAAADAGRRMGALTAQSADGEPVLALLKAHSAYLEQVERVVSAPAGRVRLLRLRRSADELKRSVATAPIDFAPPSDRALERLRRWAIARSRIRLSVPPTVTMTTAGGSVPIGFRVRARQDGRAVAARCDPPPGSSFPVGTTRVRCTAGTGEHRTTRSFTVVVARAAPATTVQPNATPQRAPAVTPPSPGPQQGVDEG